MISGEPAVTTDELAVVAESPVSGEPVMSASEVDEVYDASVEPVGESSGGPVDIGDIFNEKEIGGTEEMLARAQLSDTQIGELVEERGKSLVELQKFYGEIIKEEHEPPDFYLDPKDYKKLEEEGIIRPGGAEKMVKLDEWIDGFCSLKTLTPETRKRLSELTQRRKMVRREILSVIEKRRKRLLAEHEQETNLLLRSLREQIKKLEDRICEIEGNPRVVARIQDEANREMQEEHKEVQSDIRSYIDRMRSRYNKTRQSLEELLGKELTQQLMESGDQQVNKADQEIKKELFANANKSLVQLIKKGDIKDKRDIIPWAGVKYPISYNEMMDFIAPYSKDNGGRAVSERIALLVKIKVLPAKVSDEIKGILETHNTFSRLFGPKHKKENGKLRLAPFWQAFDDIWRKKQGQVGQSASNEGYKGGARRVNTNKKSPHHSYIDKTLRGGKAFNTPRIVGDNKED